MTKTNSTQVVANQRIFISLALAVALGTVLGYLVYLQTATPYVRDRVKDPIVLDLWDMIRQNRVQLEAPSGANAVDYVQTKTFTINGDTRDVIYMHPTSSASFHWRLPDQVLLEFAVGIDSAVWDKAGDGVEFQVEVHDGDKSTTVFSTYLDPKKNPADRRWVDTSVDLSPWAFRDIDLLLRTRPAASADFDWAGWATPRIVLANP